MATYRKGESQEGLEQAAKQQAVVRKNTDAVTKGRAGLGGGGHPYLSNLNVTKAGAHSKDYSKKDSKTGEAPIIHQSGVAVSGLQVAERSKKMLADSHLSKQLTPVKKIGNQKAAFGEVGSGRIKGGVLQPSKSAAPKKKEATAKDVRAALKSKNISIEEAKGLNKKGLSSPIKKKK